MRVLQGVFLVLSLLILGLIPAVQAQDATPEHEMASSMTQETRHLIADIRAATADFEDVQAATDAGYGKFQDCFQSESIGGMGQHYVNGDLAGDDIADPLRPEALVYEPTEDGGLVLV